MSTDPPRIRKKTRTDLSRRGVVAAGAAFAAAGLPSAASAALRESGPSVEAIVLSIFRHREDAERLGHVALAAWPQMRDRRRILARIVTELGMGEDSVARIDTGDVAQRLAQRIRDDFAIGRTLMLDGWMLSLTETRLYVLAALAQG